MPTKNWVINLSFRTLSEAEMSLLNKGLNFAVSPASVSATEIIVRLSQQLGHWKRSEQTRQGDLVHTILQQAQPPTPNITKT